VTELVREPFLSTYLSRGGTRLGDWPAIWRRVGPRVEQAAQAEKEGTPARSPAVPTLPTEEQLQLLESLLGGDLPPLDSLPEELRSDPPELPPTVAAALAAAGFRVLSFSRVVTTRGKPHD
jgi:hypothetical protein